MVTTICSLRCMVHTHLKLCLWVILNDRGNANIINDKKQDIKFYVQYDPNFILKSVCIEI